MILVDKNEPLKDKGRYYLGFGLSRVKTVDTSKFMIHRDEDIKSAVEWLQQEIDSLPKDISRKQLEVQLWHIIPIAFQDVIKKEVSGNSSHN